ncbi:MAG: DUF115 domain-containing protein, partial [Magnetococcales bacterium]|nr:DUF115 domain-containing protein [Magnetococcales bacterium]
MNRFGERYLPGVNQEAFSRVGSENLFGQQFSEFFSKEESLFLVAGTDSGLLVNWVLNRKRPDGTRFVFLEFPELIRRLREEGVLPEELPHGVLLCPPDQWVVEAEKLSLRDYFYLGQVYPVKSLAAMDGIHDGYVGMFNELETAFGQYRLQVGQEIGNRVFMMKCLENLAENRVPASVLKDRFQGRTAILLAGGPSLPESFPWIRQHREHLTILAVARVADHLRREGVVPDLLFAIDPHDVIFHQSKGMLPFWKQTLLVNMYHLNPTLLGQWCGRNVYMGVLFPWETPLNPPVNVQYPGITVGHQALGMAIDMGFSRVVLAGFDLCFSREGFTHVAGSVEQEIGPYISRSDLMVQTNGGWMAETRHDFLNAIPSLAALACFAAERQCRLINPADSAARIDGVDHLPWAEVSCASHPVPAREVLSQVVPPESSATRNAHYQAVEQELNRVRKQVVEVKELAVEGIACNDALFGRKGKPPDFKFKKRMDEIERTLDETLLEVSRLVKKWGLAAMLKLSRPDKEREWSDEEIEQAGRRYYVIYRDNANALIKLLDAVRQRLLSRMEEEKPHPHFKSLLTQWRRDDQPGRCKVLLERHPRLADTLPPPIREGFAALEETFRQLMAQTEHDYKNYLMAQQSSPMVIRAKANALFRNRERDRLRQFGEGLAKSALAEKGQYAHLIQGFLAEMERQPEQAVRHYRQVTLEILLPESLQRIFTIALQEHDLLTALAVSKRLSQYSFFHVPYYAELLRLTGDGQSAVSIFEDYLKVVQKDFVTMVKLGKLYLELGQPEEAGKTFGRILADDPENRAARTFLAELDGAGPGGER